ncbi:MAG: hypothetical protein QM770_01585 [Tepidisphaeraceae bacterium]
MLIKERSPGDQERLKRLADREKVALRRDLIVLSSCSLKAKKRSTSQAIGRARHSVQDWAYAHRYAASTRSSRHDNVGRTPKLLRECESLTSAATAAANAVER